MVELRCPACGRANAVRGGADMQAVRCAECGGELDPHVHVRYAVLRGKHAHGPYILRDMLRAASQGELLPDTRVSEEGGPFFLASERDEFFVRAGRARPAATEATAIPGPVMVMVVLTGIVTGLLFFAAVAAGIALGSFEPGIGFIVGVLLAGAAFASLAIMRGLRRGSAVARGILLALSLCAGVLLLLWHLEEGLDPRHLLPGLALAALPYALLLNPTANAFFATRPRS